MIRTALLLVYQPWWCCIWNRLRYGSVESRCASIPQESLIACLQSIQIAIKHSANIYFFVQITNRAASRIFSCSCAACSRSCCDCNLCIISNIMHTPCISMCDSHCVAIGLPVMLAAYQRVAVMHYKGGLLQYVLLASVIYIVLQNVCHELQHDQSPCTYRTTLESPDVVPSVVKERPSHILAIHKQDALHCWCHCG